MNRDTRTFLLGVGFFVLGTFIVIEVYNEGFELWEDWVRFILATILQIYGFNKIKKTTD